MCMGPIKCRLLPRLRAQADKARNAAQDLTESGVKNQKESGASFASRRISAILGAGGIMQELANALKQSHAWIQSLVAGFEDAVFKGTPIQQMIKLRDKKQKEIEVPCLCTMTMCFPHIQRMLRKGSMTSRLASLR